MKIVNKENAQVVINFQKYFFRQAYKKLLLMLLVAIFVSIVCFILKLTTLGIFVIAFYIMFLIFFPASFYFANKKLNKSNASLMEEKTIEYNFDESNYSLKVYKQQEMINSMVCKYENIFKIEETKKEFYIYIASNQALCIIKENMQESEVNDLRGILQSKVSKYKRIKW